MLEGLVAADTVSTTIAVYCRAAPIVTTDTMAVATTIMKDFGTALRPVPACLGTLVRRGTTSKTAADFGIPAVVTIAVELRFGGDAIGWQQSDGACRYRKAHGARYQSAKQGLISHPPDRSALAYKPDVEIGWSACAALRSEIQIET